MAVWVYYNTSVRCPITLISLLIVVRGSREEAEMFLRRVETSVDQVV